MSRASGVDVNEKKDFKGKRKGFRGRGKDGFQKVGNNATKSRKRTKGK